MNLTLRNMLLRSHVKTAGHLEETIMILGATLLSGVLLVGLVNLVDFCLDWWICGCLVYLCLRSWTFGWAVGHVAVLVDTQLVQ